MAMNRTFLQGILLTIQEKLGLSALCDAVDALPASSTTASSAEVSSLTNQPASVTTATTPGTGTCAVQFTFKDAQGVALNHAVAGGAYFSNSAGTAFAAATSGATLTNGAWNESKAGALAQYITTAAGLLGVTVTAAAGTYYISFELPNGKIVTSSAIVCN
jgi:hypothetical protein